MNTVDDIEPSAYTSAPRLDVPSLIALGNQLLAAAPEDLPALAQTCKKQLLTITRALADGYQLVQVEDPNEDKRPIDRFADNSWVSCKTRLEPYTWLEEARFPVATRAKYLMRRIFPTGLTFVQLEYGAQWSEASWRIKVIADENLEPELRTLCGDLFIDELFHWHKEYGKMVGTVAVRRGKKAKATPATPRPNLTELRRQAAQAVVAWQLQLVALHLAGHPDARAGLRPTDEYRAKLSAAAEPKTAAEPPTPGTPVPTAGPQLEPNSSEA